MTPFDEKKLRKIITDSVFWGILRAAFALLLISLVIQFFMNGPF